MGANFVSKVAQIFCQFLGLYAKCHFLNKASVATFWQRLKIIRLHSVPTSVYFDGDVVSRVTLLKLSLQLGSNTSTWRKNSKQIVATLKPSGDYFVMLCWFHVQPANLLKRVYRARSISTKGQLKPWFESLQGILICDCSSI